MSDAPPRRVIVVGGGGQIGRALLATAPPHMSVTGLARSALDITRPQDIAAAIRRHRPDMLINAAAYTAVDAAEAAPLAAFATNTSGPRTLATVAARHGVRMVHLSTDFVFDGLRSTPYPPDAQRSPINVYGESKAAAELAVAEALPDALIVRTAWVYAAAGRNFVTTMLRRMKGGGPIHVVSDQIGTPTHARSFATCLWSLVDTDARGLWHLTDSGTASWHDFATAIAEEASARGIIPRPPRIEPIPAAEYPTPARRPAYSVLDCAATWASIGRVGPAWRDELTRMLSSLSAPADQEGILA